MVGFHQDHCECALCKGRRRRWVLKTDETEIQSEALAVCFSATEAHMNSAVLTDSLSWLSDTSLSLISAERALGTVAQGLYRFERSGSSAFSFTQIRAPAFAGL